MAREIKYFGKLHSRPSTKALRIYFEGCLIDIGCGTKLYQELLASYVTEHIRVDHQQTLHDKSTIDRFGTAYDFPAEDEKFDCALCTAVLEHLEEPEMALKECWRVLKRRGEPSIQFLSYGTCMKSRVIFIVFQNMD